MSTKRIGDYGELLAASYLENNEFVVIRYNYRTAQGEIDVIAKKSGVLHFVEVKTAAGSEMILPREKVNSQKQRKIKKVAEEFMLREGDFNCTEVSFDVIEIVLNQVEGAF